jgi:hypothetical protein
VLAVVAHGGAALVLYVLGLGGGVRGIVRDERGWIRDEAGAAVEVKRLA